MNTITQKECDYISPQSIFLKMEQEGLLCSSDFVDLDGNHEGFNTTNTDITWDI